MEKEEKLKAPSLKTQKSSDGFGSAFEHFLDVEKISECAERGGEKDLFKMYQEKPKKSCVLLLLLIC